MAGGFVVDENIAAVEGLKLVDQANEGGFTGTRRAEDGNNFAWRNAERNAVQNGAIAVAFYHIPELDAGVFQM